MIDYPSSVKSPLEWAFEDRDELMEDWELAITKKLLRKIPLLVQEV
jgi:hypothetical protein